jgi:hypothetical protein
MGLFGTLINAMWLNNNLSLVLAQCRDRVGVACTEYFIDKYLLSAMIRSAPVVSDTAVNETW